MDFTPPPPKPNRLADETSPYLQQHKHNPVDWWPWSPEALTEARRSRKPILLSVGYAACHWCHVMAHESFEDETTAAVMNELFVNIKVDREERPDIDQIYMSALHLLGEQGGWPLTMFLTSEGEPVWGGTYFPKTSRFGRPAFVDVLREIARLFRDEPDRIEHNRRILMQNLADRARPKERVVIGLRELDDIAYRVADAMDPVNGGLRGAPKFPQAAVFELLWRAGQRTGNEHFFALVETTLDRICQGGIYDHLGGGFARYSVDERWLVPHFEKMLYDNALLIELLSLASTRSPKPLYRQCVEETVTWLAHEMRTSNGTFAASIDADSEGEEGKFYLWSRHDIDSILGRSNAAFFAAHYDVSTEGNFEGANIINCLKGLPRSKEDESKLRMLRSMLHKRRSERVPPARDDKILADWNALAIAALTRASVVFAEPSWMALAESAFRAILDTMTRDGRLGHSWRDNRLIFPGLACDFANMIRAAIALFEATAETAYLDQAMQWQQALDRHYANTDNSGYFLTADDATGLVVRPNGTADDATPNPNGVAAQNLVRLAVLCGDDAWRQRADALLDGVLASGASNLIVHATLLNALDLRLRGAEIVVTGSGPQADALLAAARRLPAVDHIVLPAAAAETLAPDHPARAKLVATPAAAAFVCVAETCSLPVTTPDGIARAVAAMRG